MLETHTLLAAMTHRRMIDPAYFKKRARPFVIERASHAATSTTASGQNPELVRVSGQGGER
jgi:hypothetical protein